jgi:hypothetical protein
MRGARCPLGNGDGSVRTCGSGSMASNLVDIAAGCGGNVDAFTSPTNLAESLDRLVTDVSEPGRRVSNTATSPRFMVMSWLARISRSCPAST